MLGYVEDVVSSAMTFLEKERSYTAEQVGAWAPLWRHADLLEACARMVSQGSKEFVALAAENGLVHKRGLWAGRGKGFLSLAGIAEVDNSWLRQVAECEKADMSFATDLARLWSNPQMVGRLEWTGAVNDARIAVAALITSENPKLVRKTSSTGKTKVLRVGGDLNQRAADAHKACTVLVSMGPAAEALATDEFGREKWAIAQEAMKLFNASANERSEKFADILGFMVKEVREAIPKYDGTDLGGSAGSPVRFVCLCVAGMRAGTFSAKVGEGGSPH